MPLTGRANHYMEKLIEKLYLRENQRICILNSDGDLVSSLRMARPTITVDEKIDPRYLYNFFLIFVKSREMVDDLSNRAVHNLYEDGILWFAYPRNGNKEDTSLSGKEGWGILKELGFKPVRNIIIDDSWNGIRFRNSKFVKSSRNSNP